MVPTPLKSSLIGVPKPMIIAGSRFRETYYWDAFWTMKGLLASGMRRAALNVVLNFLHLIEVYGFIPNGLRVWYRENTCTFSLASLP
jgi:alpha,alpha-trehalase